MVRREAIILDCHAKGESPIDVRWLKNGATVAENDRVYLLSNGSLYISEVESRRGDKSDEGLYQCLAQNKYGAILSQKARLTIASKQLIYFKEVPEILAPHAHLSRLLGGFRGPKSELGGGIGVFRKAKHRSGDVQDNVKNR